MKKNICLALILFLILFLSGCSITRVNNESFDSIINTVLYKDNDLFNVSFEGYKFYLPRGTMVSEKKEYNLEINDSKNIYYLYVDTIAYYYKTKVEHEIDNSLFYSKNLNYKDIYGYIDISKIDNKYFVEVMYNYAKIESYVDSDNLNEAFLNICYILSSIRFNDSAISYKLSNHEFDYTTEEFNIFKSKKDDDNFLKYVEEFDRYSDNTTNKHDDDIIETNEGE